MQVGNISVKLGLVTLEFDKKVEGAKKQAKELQAALDTLGGGIKTLNGYWKQLGGSLSVGSIGFAALLQQTIAFTDEISDLAKGFDITIGQTLAFRSALQGAGVDAAGASKMMSTLFGKISDGQKGNDVVVAQFEKLGISFQDLQKMNPYEAIQKVAQGFSNVSNSFEKVKLIKEFFGKAGIGVDIQQISDALAQGTGSFDKYAESIKRVGVIEDNMKRSLDNLKIAFADMIAPFTRDGIVSIEKFQATLASIAAVSVVSGLIAIAPALKAITMAMWGLIAGTEAFNAVAGGVTPMGLLLKAGVLLAGVGAYLYTMNSLENAKISPEANMRAYVPRDNYKGETGEPVKQLTTEQEALNAQIKLQNILLGIEKEKSKLQIQSVMSDTLQNQLLLNEVNSREKIAQIEFKRMQDLAKAKDNTPEYRAMINKEASSKIAVANLQLQTMQKMAVASAKMKSDIAGLMANNIIEDNDQETPAQMREAENARIRARVGLSNQVKDTARLTDLENKRLSFSNKLLFSSDRERDLALERYDLEAKIADYRREAMLKGETNQARIEAMIQTIRDAGEETIRLKQISIDTQRTFEYGWAQAFNSFAENSTNMAKVAGDSFNSIISNMDSALDSFVKTGKLNFKNFARSIIQDLIAIQLKASANSIFKMMFGPNIGGINTSGADLAMFYADGGDPPVNKPAIVGERGPELFIPKTAGTVIPNHALSNMGSTTNVTNNYINAIDTASFEQRLLASPNAIWAANTYANKTLATSRGRA